MTLLSLIIGYLIGCLMPGYFFARVRGFDIRTRGSGETGTSNVARTMGYGVATIVGVFDVFKGPGAILVARALSDSPTFGYLGGAAAVVGHRWPFYLRFHGGGGLATAVGIMAYALFMSLKQDWRFAFVCIPLFAVLGVVFFVRLRRNSNNKILAFIFLPILLNAMILFYGLNLHTGAVGAVSLYMIGYFLVQALRPMHQALPESERKLLRRKWLRPFAIVFPLGMFLSGPITLLVLAAVFLVFVILEIVRFKTRYQRFPVPYRRGEARRISSMVMFLFATLLVFLFFSVPIASLAVSFLIFGDLLAWCVGTTIGGRRLLQKTWSGTLACLATCFTLGVLYHALSLVSLPVGAIGAVSATAVEASPIEEDNFVMPVVSAILMTLASSWH